MPIHNSFFAAGAVIVCDNRNHAIVQAENRHEDKTLQLEINTKNGYSGSGKADKNQIHSVGHDRGNGLHNNRRKSDRVNNPDDPRIRTEAAHVNADIMVFL